MNYFLSLYKNFWVKAFDFKGKINRKEFWLVVLANFIFISLLNILNIISYSNHSENNGGDLFGADAQYRLLFEITLGLIYFYSYAIFIPTLSLQIRRVRDVGKDWYWILINFIPVIGNIYYLIYLCKPSNRYIDLENKLDKINTLKTKKKIDEKNNGSFTNELLKLVDLKERGLLTEEEFKAAKSKLLN